LPRLDNIIEGGGKSGLCRTTIKVKPGKGEEKQTEVQCGKVAACTTEASSAMNRENAERKGKIRKPVWASHCMQNGEVLGVVGNRLQWRAPGEKRGR